MTSWRSDSDLAARFHPQFPDDVQVAVHDGEPRRTGKVPELCWVRITGVYGCARFPDHEFNAPEDVLNWRDRTIYRAMLLNQPHHLMTIRQGQPLLFLVPLGLRHPLQLTEAYLAERQRWVVNPCDRCGLNHTLDPPTTMHRTRFPDLSHKPDEVIMCFSAFCFCGGTMVLRRVSGSSASPPP